MPTYTNSGTSDVALGSYTLAPGKSVEINSFFTNLPTGVTKTATAPVWNPILISEIDNGNAGDFKTITLTSVQAGADGGYIELSFNCLAGTASVYFNDTTAFNPPLLLSTGEWTVIKASLVNVATIIIAFTAASSSVKTDVFKW